MSSCWARAAGRIGSEYQLDLKRPGVENDKIPNGKYMLQELRRLSLIGLIYLDPPGVAELELGIVSWDVQLTLHLRRSNEDEK